MSITTYLSTSTSNDLKRHFSPEAPLDDAQQSFQVLPMYRSDPLRRASSYLAWSELTVLCKGRFHLRQTGRRRGICRGAGDQLPQSVDLSPQAV